MCMEKGDFSLKEVRYCPLCKKAFCAKCEVAYPDRVLSFMREVAGAVKRRFG